MLESTLSPGDRDRVDDLLEFWKSVAAERERIKRGTREAAFPELRAQSAVLLDNLDHLLLKMANEGAGIPSIRKSLRDSRLIRAIALLEDVLFCQKANQIGEEDRMGFFHEAYEELAGHLDVSQELVVLGIASDPIKAALAAEGPKTAAVCLVAELSKVSDRTLWRVLERLSPEPEPEPEPEP